MKHPRYESGQALVLVLLSLAVVVTVVLFVLSRSVTDIAVSDFESQSISAFSAAEAGVERSLVVGAGSSSNVGDASYNAQVTNVASGATYFIYPIELNSGDTATLWFNSQDLSSDFTGTTLKVCWGKTGTASNLAVTPAIEVSIYYETTAGNPATAKISRVTADPYTGSGRTQNNLFSGVNAASVISGQTFPFCKIINLASPSLPNLQFATIRMFYNTNTSHPIAFDSTTASTFPTQGMLIDSSGTSGQSNRKVQVFQSWPEVPSTFLYGIYSPVGLTK